MPRVTAIIPARLESVRFPGKVLHLIKGKPLIYHVWKAVSSARKIDRVFVATDSPEIGRAVIAFGGAVMMTSKKPRNGTERTAEALRNYKTDIIINVQCDSLGLKDSDLDRVIAGMAAEPKISFATLARKFDRNDWKIRLASPHVVKVVANSEGNALWFSRYPIPCIKNPDLRPYPDQFPFLEHIGVYFYRKAALLRYAGWPQGKIEKAESLEQLRILERGEKIRLFPTKTKIISIDHRDDLKNITGVRR